MSLINTVCSEQNSFNNFKREYFSFPKAFLLQMTRMSLGKQQGKSTKILIFSYSTLIPNTRFAFNLLLNTLLYFIQIMIIIINTKI